VCNLQRGRPRFQKASRETLSAAAASGESPGWAPRLLPVVHLVMEGHMNLVIWLPGLLALGLATIALMYVFTGGCDRV
jgi:hypothetical protein